MQEDWYLQIVNHAFIVTNTQEDQCKN